MGREDIIIVVGVVAEVRVGVVIGALPEQSRCQQSRRAGLAINVSTDRACVSHAFEVCVMVTSALQSYRD